MLDGEGPEDIEENDLSGGDDGDDVDDEPHASDSAVQREAEGEVLRKASQYFQRELTPTTMQTPSGLPMKVDGVAEDRSVLVEVYVRQTRLLPGNKRKIMTDVLRLTWLRRHMEPRPHVAICLTSWDAAKTLLWDRERERWPGWAAEVLHDLDVDVCVFTLDDDGPAREAASRQKR